MFLNTKASSSQAASAIFAPVADITALKALDTTSAILFPDKIIINVEANGIYRLDRDSTATGDDNRIVEPTVGTGRWFKNTPQQADHNNQDLLQGGTAGEFFHLTNAELISLGLAILKDGSITYVANQPMGGFRTVGAGDPVDAQDYTTKSYVDGFINGASWKLACRAATTGNITISGAQTIDGVTLIDNDRVLVKDQTLPEENGIYIYNSAGAWPRSLDMDAAIEFVAASVAVSKGAIHADQAFNQTAEVATLGTDPVTWVFMTSMGNAILKDGSVIYIGNQNMGGFGINALLDPLLAQDAATKNYVDSNDVGAPILMFGSNNINTSTSTRQMLPWNDTGSAPSTSVPRPIVITRDGTLQNLFIAPKQAGSGSVLLTYTVHVNGSPTALIVTMLNDSAVVAFNIVDTVAVLQGDLVTLEVDKAASIGSSPTNIGCTMELK